MVRGVVGGVEVVVGGDAVWARPATGSGVVGQVPHTGTLPERPVDQSDPEELDPPVRAGPRVVPIVAAVRATPRHDPSEERERDREREERHELERLWVRVL